MSQPYTEEQDVAVEAVREAARLCQAVQARISPEVLEKKDRSPVTVADFGSQALICRTLADRFVDDPIIAEEDSAALLDGENAELLASITEHVAELRPEVDGQTIRDWIDHNAADQYTDRFWTLDPIDGTKGFLRGEQYAIALALIVGGELTFAALGCPNLDGGAIYTAVAGQGAWKQSLDGGKAEPIRVSETTDPAAARFCESVESGHSAHGRSAQVAEDLGITAEPVRLDSQAKYATVADGRADIYMRIPTRPDYVEKIWDHAAGALLIEQAGGRVTDVTGKPLDFSRGAGLSGNSGIIATNGALHQPVVEAVNRVGVA